MIDILWPWVLAALPLPWIIRTLLPAQDKAGQTGAAIKVPFYAQILETQGTEQNPQLSIDRKIIYALIIWILVILAGINPVWIGEPVQLPTLGRNLMLAVDVSPSMQEKDLTLGNQPVDRLTVLKSVMSDFIERREGDRLGLILFGSHAYLQTPLTLDRKTVNTLLDEAQIGIAGKATAIGDAIGMGLKKLLDTESTEKVLILATDGANTTGEINPLKAAELAALENLSIYTIGIGADSMQLPGIFGSAFGSRHINPSRDLDEKMLMEIAEKTGGQYFRAKTSDDLQSIYQQLDKLEPVSGENQTYRPKKSLFYIPLGLAFILSLLMAASSLSLSGVRYSLTQGRKINNND